MKNFFLMIMILFSLNTYSKERNISLMKFFPESSLTYSGGFENSNFKVITKKISNDLVMQKTETTAVNGTKVIKITPDSAVIVFKSNEGEEYKKGKINKNTVLIKYPLKKGNAWESEGNKYIIDSFDGKILVITRNNGYSKIESTYEVNKGLIKETFESEGLKKESKIIK